MNGFYAKVWAGERLSSKQRCWYFRVYAPNGDVVAMDNTGNWRKIYENAYRLVRTFNECQTRGIEIKQPEWIKEYTV